MKFYRPTRWQWWRARLTFGSRERAEICFDLFTWSFGPTYMPDFGHRIGLSLGPVEIGVELNWATCRFQNLFTR
jgi:hypothetical protein